MTLRQAFNILLLLALAVSLAIALTPADEPGHAASCSDGKLGEAETDVDCGGALCAPCEDGRRCDVNADCLSGACDADRGICIAQSCADGRRSANESDVDCGGPLCLPCEDGARCLLSRDCSSSLCRDNICLPATCADGLLSGNETDVDCGGGACLPCADGKDCSIGLRDCESGACGSTSGKCAPKTCSDGIQNGNETGVDCGGGACEPCAAASRCRTHADCESGMCDAASQRCLDPSCADGVRNGEETAVDCGGPLCGLCGLGKECLSHADCASQLCSPFLGVCLPRSCGNKVLDGNETGVDCGGDTCGPCPDGRTCNSDRDCLSKRCAEEDGVCLPETCFNGRKDANETDVDCGGDGLCQRCPRDYTCAADTDCASGFCEAEKSVCLPVACGNGRRDAESGESDVDCGQGCSPCEDGKQCTGPADCRSKICDPDSSSCVASSCVDGVLNGNETDVDCGGQACLKCEVLKRCLRNSDCASDACIDGQCRPKTCTNGVLDGNETDVDCGGGICAPCRDAEQCLKDRDCKSGSCGEHGQCLPQSCFDGRLNGNETDVDCGGICPPCQMGQDCEVARDCLTGMCHQGALICIAPSCINNVKDEEESDVDCGGNNCAPCVDFKQCNSGADCTSSLCSEVTNQCLPASCRNHALDGNETGVDCGGLCDACANGMSCDKNSDCQSELCDENSGVCLVETCADGQRNGNETDVDCGGECTQCTLGDRCARDTDCRSKFCDPKSRTCSTSTCTNGRLDDGETDVDCGGPCAKCDDGRHCEADGDCLSGACAVDDGICLSQTCADLVHNGNESDVDCGGPLCLPCEAGRHCHNGSDCMSGLCIDETCLATNCADGIMNKNETDVDCGGRQCRPCAPGRSCKSNQDCTSGACSEELGRCLAESCFDGALNGNETDVDCGGNNCERCEGGAMCFTGADCLSGLCDAATSRCVDASCMDGELNGDETDVDCGGPVCTTCGTGLNCLTDTDCTSAVCDEICRPATCRNHRIDGNETGIDCGGGECPACAAGEPCKSESDCESNICDGEKCIAGSCMDGRLGGNESDIDCGGAFCPACNIGQRCKVDEDCLSLTCDIEEAVCVAATCTNGIRDGEETDIDCGGSACGACPLLKHCRDNTDCKENLCLDGELCVAQTCGNSVLDGGETDIDCGGNGCIACSNGARCAANSDCASRLCDGGQCAPKSCRNGVLDGGETGVDCGGPHCRKCLQGQGCTRNSDCDSGLCNSRSHMCAPKSCLDTVLNLQETDTDCGGEDCPACGDLKKCTLDRDCLSGYCEDKHGRCFPARCQDGVQNKDETDVDCGGQMCMPCLEQMGCNSTRDCLSTLFCDKRSNMCLSKRCANGVQDVNETDVDCGGSCGPCPLMRTCQSHTDCESGYCQDSLCLPRDAKSRKLLLQPISCTDGFQNHGETDVDCGGADCIGCAVGGLCEEDTDCLGSLKCSSERRVCEEVSCSNGVLDAGETDVDCGGGSCSPCAAGRRCEANKDCLSHTCDEATQLCLQGTCDDGIKNNEETDTDCGGPNYNCRRCEDGLSCRRHGDCSSEFCDPTSLVCRHPSCNNGKQDEQETDVDCGGELCSPCVNGASCASNSDCASKLCAKESQTCILWNCGNGIQDGKETDVDCGGTDCLPCAIGHFCRSAQDCASGFCDPTSTCRVVSCGNGLQDGSETDVDCGGGSCAPCAQGMTCADHADCQSALCLDQTCSPPSCKNGRLDASETDVDCGGEWCPRCGVGSACREHADCHSTFCNPITNVCSDQIDESNSVVDCTNQRLTNADCASVAYGYSSCEQHLSDRICDDGGFKSDRGFLLNFNCERFNCDHEACGACGGTKGKRLRGVDVAAVEEVKDKMPTAGRLMIDMEHVENGYEVIFAGPTGLIQQAVLEELSQVDFTALDNATLGLSYGFLNAIDWAHLLHQAAPCNEDECAEQEIISGHKAAHALFGFVDLRSVDKDSVKVIGSADPEHLVVLEGFFVGGRKQRLSIQGNVRLAHLSVVLPGGLLDLSEAEEIYCEEGIIVLPGGSIDLGQGKVILTGSAEARVVVLGELKKATRASDDWWEQQQAEPTSSMPTLIDLTQLVLMGSASLEGDLQLSDRTRLSVLPGARVHFSSGRVLGKYARIANMGRLEMASSHVHIEVINRGLLVVEGKTFWKGGMTSAGLVQVEGELTVHGQRNVVMRPDPLFHPFHRVWQMYAKARYLLRPKAFQVSFEELKSGLAVVSRGSISLAANAVLATDGAHLAIVGLQHLTLAQSSTVVLASSSVLSVLPELGEDAGGETLHGTLDVQTGSIVNVLATTSLQVKGNLHVSHSSAWNVHYVSPTQRARRLQPAGNRMVAGDGRRLISTFSGVVEISGKKIVTSAEVYLSNVYVTGELVITRSGSVEFKEYAILAGKVENRGDLAITRGGHVLLAGAYEGAGGLRIERRGELIITADATIDGDVSNEGTLEIDIDRRSTLASYENNLFSTSSVANLPDCSSLGKRIRVFVQVRSSDDLQWSLPIHACAKMTAGDLLAMLPSTLQQGKLFTVSGMGLSDSSVLSDYGVGDRSSLTLEAVNSAVAALELAGQANVGIRANGGTVSFNGDIEDEGSFSIFSDAYVSFSSESAVFSNGLDSSGEIWIEKDANLELNAMSESSGNFTNDGNLTIDDEVVFSDDVENSGSILITSSGNATFEAEFTNRGDIVIDDGGSMFLEGTSEFRSSGSVDSSGEIQFSSGSFTTVDGDFVNGGTTIVAGELELDGDDIFFDGTFENTEEGSVTVEKGAHVRFTSDMSSDAPAKFRVRSGGKARFQGTATFTGDGSGEAHVFNHGNWIVAAAGVCSYVDDVFKVSGIVDVQGIVTCATSSAAEQGEILLQGDGEVDVAEDGQLNINPFCVFNAVDANSRLVNGGNVKIAQGAKVQLAGSATLKERSSMAIQGHGRFLKSSQVVSHGDLALAGDMTLDGNLTIGAKAMMTGSMQGTGHVNVASKGELTSTGNVSYHGRLTTAPGSASYMHGPTSFHEHLVVNEGTMRLGQDAVSSFGNGIDSSGELSSDGGDFHCRSLCSTGETFESNGTVVVHRDASLQMHHVLAKRLRVEKGGACHITGKAIWQEHVVNNGTLVIAASGTVLFVDGFISAGRMSNDGNATFLGKEVFFDGDYVGAGTMVVASGAHVHWHGTVYSSGKLGVEEFGQISIWSHVAVIEGILDNSGTLEVSPVSSVVFGSIQGRDDIVSQGTLRNNGNISFNSYAYINGQMDNSGDLLVRNGSTLVFGGMASSKGALSCHGQLVVTHAGQLEVEEGTIVIFQIGVFEVDGSVVVGVDASAEVSGKLVVKEGSFTNDGICTLGGGAAVDGYMANSGMLTISNMACLGQTHEKARFADNFDNFGNVVVRSCAAVVINGTLMMNGQLVTSPGAEITLAGDATHRFVRDESVSMQVINLGTLMVDTDASLSVDVDGLNLGEWDIYGVIEFMAGHRFAFRTSQADLPKLLPPSAMLDAVALSDEDRGGMSVFRGGVLRGDVVLDGDLTNDGTVNPGILGRQGLIVVNGSFHSTNTLRIDVTCDGTSSATPKSDRIVVEQDCRFTSGAIEIAMDKHYGTIKVTPIVTATNRLALSPKVELRASGLPGQEFHVEAIKTKTHHSETGQVRDALKFRISSSLSITAQTSRRRLAHENQAQRARQGVLKPTGVELRWRIWLGGIRELSFDHVAVERWAERYIGGIPRVDRVSAESSVPSSYAHVLSLKEAAGVEVHLTSLLHDKVVMESTCGVLPLVYLDLIQTLSNAHKPSPKSVALLPSSCLNSLFQCVTNGIGPARAGAPCDLEGADAQGCIGAGYGGQGWCLTKDGQRGGCSCSGVYLPADESHRAEEAKTSCLDTGEDCNTPCQFSKANDKLQCSGQSGDKCPCVIKPNLSGKYATIDAWIQVVEITADELEKFASQIKRLSGEVLHIGSVLRGERPTGLSVYKEHGLSPDASANSYIIKGFLTCGSHSCSDLCIALNDTLDELLESIPSQWSAFGLTVEGCALANVPRISRFSDVPCSTIGGGNAAEGEPCQTECGGAVLEGEQEWCFTTGYKWGYCSCGPMAGHRVESAIQGGEPSTSCWTNGFGEAPAEEPCVFPFHFRGVTYSSCLGSGFGGEGFCRTKAGLIGGCACRIDAEPSFSRLPECITNGLGTSPEGSACAFPFSYKGAVVTECVGDGYGGEGWCLDADGNRGGCDCSRHSLLKKSSTADCRTNGRGAVEAGLPCSFPFAHGGEIFTACAGSGYGGQGFCYVDGRKGGCACKDKSFAKAAHTYRCEESKQREDCEPEWCIWSDGRCTAGPAMAAGAAYFVVGPEVVRKEPDRVTIEVALSLPAQITAVALASGSAPPINGNLLDLDDAYMQSVKQNLALSPVLITLDGLDSDTLYDIYISATCVGGKAACLDDVDLKANVLEMVHTEALASASQHGDIGMLRLSVEKLDVEEGEWTSYSIVLDRAPRGSVSVEIHADPSMILPLQQLVFHAGNWHVPQIVKLKVEDDHAAEEDRIAVVTHSLRSEDERFNARDIAPLAITVRDKETATPSTMIIEPLRFEYLSPEYVYSIVPKRKPSRPITIRVQPDPGDACRALPEVLTFTAQDWTIPKQISVSVSTGWNDDITIRHEVTSEDRFFHAGHVSDVAIAMNSSAAQALRAKLDVSTTHVLVQQGASRNYSVVLSNAVSPMSPVIMKVEVHAAEPGIVQVEPSTVVFSEADLGTKKSIRVYATSHLGSGRLVHTVESADPNFAGIGPTAATFSVTHADIYGVVSSAKSMTVTEGESASYSLRLSGPPDGEVSIRLHSDSGTCITATGRDLTARCSADSQGCLCERNTLVTLSTRHITFTARNWSVPVNVDVAAIADNITEGEHVAVITHHVESVEDDRFDHAVIYMQSGEDIVQLKGNELVVQIQDQGRPALAFSPTLLHLEEGSGRDASYSMSLSSRPWTRVVVNVVEDGTLRVRPHEVVFMPNNWHLPQRVQVRAVDNKDTSGVNKYFLKLKHNVKSRDEAFNGLRADMHIGVAEDDAAHVVCSTAKVTLGRASLFSSVSLVLTATPASKVKVKLTSANGQTHIRPAELVFSADDWDLPQEIFIASSHSGASLSDVVVLRALSDDCKYNDGAKCCVEMDHEGQCGAWATTAATTQNISVAGWKDTYTGVNEAAFSVDRVSEAVLNISLITLIDLPSVVATLESKSLGLSPAKFVLTEKKPYQAVVLQRTDCSAEESVVHIRAGHLMLTETITSSSLGDCVPKSNPLPISSMPHTTAKAVEVVVKGRLTLIEGKTEKLVLTAANLQAPTQINVIATSGSCVQTSTFLKLCGEGIPCPEEQSQQCVGSTRLLAAPSLIRLTSANPKAVVSVTASADNVVEELMQAGEIRLSIQGEPKRAVHILTEDGSVLSKGGRISMLLTEEDAAGLMLTPNDVLHIDGGVCHVAVRLTSRPLSAVSVNMTEVSGVALEIDPRSITFNRSNWDTPLLFTVRAAEETPLTAVRITASSRDQEYAKLGYHLQVRMPPGQLPILTSTSHLMVEEGERVLYRIRLGRRPRVPPEFSEEAVVVTPAVQPLVGLCSGPARQWCIAHGDCGAASSCLVKARVRVKPERLVFSADAWDVWQEVSVTAVDDAHFQGMRIVAEIGHHAHSFDPGFGKHNASLSVVVRENEKPHVLVSQRHLFLKEGGSSTYGIKLASEPWAPVNVSMSLSTLVTTSVRYVVISPAEWDTWHDVGVYSVDNKESAQAGTADAWISHRSTSDDPWYDGLQSSTMVVTVEDDEKPSIVLSNASNLQVKEGEEGKYAVAMAHAPSSATKIEISIAAGACAEEGHAAQYELMCAKDEDCVRFCADEQCQKDVRCVGSGSAWITAGQHLTFTPQNWATPQEVRFATRDDSVAKPQRYRVKLLHKVGEEVVALLAVIIDNDKPDLLLSPDPLTLASVASPEATYSVKLASKPVLPVRVDLRQANGAAIRFHVSGAACHPCSLEFTGKSWNTPREVKVVVASSQKGFAIRSNKVLHTVTSDDPMYANLRRPMDLLPPKENTAAALISTPRTVALSENVTKPVDISVRLGWRPHRGRCSGSQWPCSTDADCKREVHLGDPLLPSSTCQVSATAVETTVSVTVLNGHCVYGDSDHRPDELCNSALDCKDLTATCMLRTKARLLEAEGDEGMLLSFKHGAWDVARTVRLVVEDDDVDEPDRHRTNLLLRVVTSPDYQLLNQTLIVPVFIYDNDAAGVQVFVPSKKGRMVKPTKILQSGTYFLRLTSRPVSTVSVYIHHDASTRVVAQGRSSEGAGPVQVDFLQDDWQEEIQVFVDSEGAAPPLSLVSHTVVSNDASFNGISVDPVYIEGTGDNRGMEIDLPSDSIHVGRGRTEAFSVRLTFKPRATVAVGLAVMAKGAVRLSAQELRFSPDTWDIWRTVKVSANVSARNVQTVIRLEAYCSEHCAMANAVGEVAVEVDERHTRMPPFQWRINDAAELVLSRKKLSVREAWSNSAETYEASLTAAPSETVVVHVHARDGTCSGTIAHHNAWPCERDEDCLASERCVRGTRVYTSPEKLTFTPANWSLPQMISVHAFDDNVAEPAVHQTTIEHEIVDEQGHRRSLSLDVDIHDAGAFDLVIRPPMLLVHEGEGWRGTTYTVALNAKPTGDVVVQIINRPGSGLKFRPNRLVFPALGEIMEMDVHVTASDNQTAMPSPTVAHIEHRVFSADSAVDGTRKFVQISRTDQDAAGLELSISDILLREGDGQIQTVFVNLASRPVHNVTVHMTFPTGRCSSTWEKLCSTSEDCNDGICVSGVHLFASRQTVIFSPLDWHQRKALR